jgi:CRISPR-associated protein Cmr6
VSAPRPHVMRDTALHEISHLGLALARYLPAEQGSDKPKDLLLRALAGDGDRPGTFSRLSKSLPDGYGRHYRHLLRAAAQATPVTRVLTLHSTSRSVVGLGTESPLENSLSTHHTYGVPVLPGSALKGLCASFARRHYEGWEPDLVGGPYRRIFGYAPAEGRQQARTDLGQAGLVTFADALPVPGEWTLHREVMTTHHSPYYTGSGDAPPADWDEPVPVPFVSVAGSFSLLLSADGPDAAAGLDAVTALLTAALHEEGVGAKTSSGFGRFRVDVPAATPVSAGAVTPPGASAVTAPLFPAWLEADLKAKWSVNQLTNPGGKIHQSAHRIVQEAASGALAPGVAREGARALLDKFAAVPKGTVRRYKWYDALVSVMENGA